MAPDAPRTRSRAAAAAAAPAQALQLGDTHTNVNVDTALGAAVRARAQILGIVFADPETGLEDGLSIADELWAWVSNPDALAPFVGNPL